MLLNILVSLLKGGAIKKLVRTAIKSALKAYVIQTDNKLDDTIYSIIVKIQDGKSIDDEVAFIVNTYGVKLSGKIDELQDKIKNKIGR